LRSNSRLEVLFAGSTDATETSGRTSWFDPQAGGLGIRVTEPETLDDAIRNALDSLLPSLVEVVVDSELYIKAVRRT
jgi:thiamine pyrophosphate-dependent acetolactate synthase large subunit-like protein